MNEHNRRVLVFWLFTFLVLAHACGLTVMQVAH